MTNQELWNSRAHLGEAAGTNDVILKRLEIAELLRRVPPFSRVLDVGCGNGLTLQTLAQEKHCRGLGIDAAPEMVQAARALEIGGVAFKLDDIRDYYAGHDYDVAITERCLINLSDLDAQHVAFRNIMAALKPGGIYYMIENSYDGLVRLNTLRAIHGLPPMRPPWHNVYFHEADVLQWQTPNCILEEIAHFTSTYYLLSRVVYAKLCADAGTEPEYESPINLQALRLPSFGDLGATRLWVWRKR